MSLGIVIKGPEGLVLAAESRLTLTATPSKGHPLHVNFDNATKLLSFGKPNNYVGAVTFGQAAIGQRTAHSFIPEFEADLRKGGNGKGRLTTEAFAKRLSSFYMRQWNAHHPDPAKYHGPEMAFLVAGFDVNEPYGRVFRFDLPHSPAPVEQHANTLDGQKAVVNFGLSWGGQNDIVDRLIHGHDPRLIGAIGKHLALDAQKTDEIVQIARNFGMPLPVQAMALQDCVDTALFFIRTTIAAQKLTIGIRGCGGPIDVAVITSNEPLLFVQRKKLHGEQGSAYNSQEEA